MGFKALTVNTAAEAAGHIYAEDDAAIFQSMFGGDGVLNIGNCLKSTVISNNKVRISDGVLSVGGHIGRLSHADYQDMTIENGATGYNRNDIIYARFLTSGNVDSFILAVKKGTATTGTASDPALVQGNLYDGAVERDYPLYRVKLSGLSIASVDQLFTVIPTIPDLKAQMAKDKAEINQSLTNVNNSKKTYLRLILPNIAADAKAVCDYINKNYLMGQITPMYSIEFDVVASNVDWFSGVLSTDSNVDSNARTVWGIVQRRSISADNSTLYKYFGSGAGGAGTVSPFKRYEDGYNTGYAAGQSAGVPSGSCIAGWRSIDSYSNGQWVTGWVGVNPNFFTVNSAGIVPTKNFTATVYWQGYNKRDIDFFSNGEMGHRNNGTSLDGVQMNFYAGTQCGFKTNDSGGGSLGAGFIVLN
jgi:hypothetical protein|nr:MAG TPA: hypothetical protein [Caudoviricetes sp.]